MDAGVYEGSEVSIYYDPMLAKLIVWAADREHALNRLERALYELRVEGIRTTAPLFRALLADADFRSGNLDIGMLDRKLAAGELQPVDRGRRRGLAADLPLIAAALAHHEQAQPAERRRPGLARGLPALALGRRRTPRRHAGGGYHGSDRPPGKARGEGPGAPRRRRLRGDASASAPTTWTPCRPAPACTACGSTADASHEVAVRHQGRGHLLGEHRRRAPAPSRSSIPSTYLAAQTHGAQGGKRRQRVDAYMPGRVVAVLVQEGEAVTAGQGIIVLEAMKMENEIRAEHDGIVSKIHVQPGQAVDKGNPLFEME